MPKEDDQDKQTDTGNATGDSKDQGQDQGGAANTDTDKSKDKTAKDKTFSEADVDRRVQAAVAKALGTKKAEWDEEQKAILAAKEEEADQKRLEEKGEYKALHEKSTAELDALKAEKAAHEHADAVRVVLKEAGMSEFADVLLAPRDNVDSIKDHAAEIKTLIDARVAAEVGEKLKTGRRPTGPAGTPPAANADKPSTWTTDQLKEYFKTHSQGDHQALVESEAEARVSKSA